MATITTTVNEMNPLGVSLTFTDVNGVPYIPQSIQWLLWDDTNKIQLQDYTDLIPALSVYFEIPGTLNVINNPSNFSERRMFLIRTVLPNSEPRFDVSYYNVLAIPDIGAT